MKFLPLFRLTLTHSYYTNGRCPDFRIEATTATQRLLKNQRATLRILPDGLQVLTAVNQDNTPFIAMPETAVFTFQLYLQNQTFPLFTNLTEINQQPAPLYIYQTDVEQNPHPLTLTTRQPKTTENFIIHNPSTKEIFTLSGKPTTGLTKSDFALTGANISSTPTQYNESTKQITINTKSANPGASFTAAYAVQPQRPRNSFAEIEIHIPAQTELTNEGKQLQIDFMAKQARWRYYVIADNTDAQFQIEDKANPPLSFSDANRTNLNQNSDPSDDIAASLAQKYPQMQRYRFLSDDLIFCQQQARKSLQLRLDGNQVAGTLPNPPLTNFAVATTDQNGAPQKEDTLFQIIKYFNLDATKGGI